MKKHSKIIALMLAIVSVMSIALAACSTPSAENTDPNTQPLATQPCWPSPSRQFRNSLHRETIRRRTQDRSTNRQACGARHLPEAIHILTDFPTTSLI